MFIDVSKGTERKNGAIEFCCPGTAEWICSNPLAPFFQRLSSTFGGDAFLFSPLPALLISLFQFLQANQLTLFPQDISLVFAQAGGTDTSQVLDITWTPQIEYRVIANDEGAGDGQQFTCDTLE